ncbi:MAG TPA: acyltransferase [Gemmatimonadaceae bacterium]
MNKAFSIYLDLVRFLAAFVVVLYHSRDVLWIPWSIARYGNEAVIVFFVLSGYVISFVADEKEKTLKAFAISRATRIYSVAIPALVLTWFLDTVGFHLLNSAAYPPGKRAWSLPLVRAFAGLTFTGEIWDTSIQMFSNLPYWSLHYEVWYYAAFAVLTYIGGRKRTMLFVLLCAFVGPKLLLLMPVWWAGVLLYRWQRLRNISMNAGYLMVALSTMALFLYNPMGPQAAPTVAFYPLGFSDRFLTDYLFALIVVAHFLGVRAICLRHGSLLLAAERPIRSLAATTFALYLLHQPLLLFFNAAYFAQPFTMTRYVLVMLSTILSAFALNNAIEANKKPLRWVIARLADGVHTSSYRLLRPFAKTT